MECSLSRCLFESFQNYFLKEKFVKVFRKKIVYIASSWLCFFSFSSTDMLWNQKVVKNIPLTCKHWIIEKRNPLISVFEKNEFLRNVWFSAHLFKQIKMLTFLKISKNFQKYWNWRVNLSSVYVYLAELHSQTPMHATRLDIHYSSSSCQ